MSLKNLESTPINPPLFIFKVRKKVYKILTPSDKKGDISWYFDIILISLIFLNVIAIVLESIPYLRTNYGTQFHIFDLVSVLFFTAEYILRVWTCNEEEKYKTPVLGNLKFMGSTMAIIDLLSIIPFYLPLMGFDLRIFRILRLMRLFRLFKLSPYVRAIRIMDSVIKEKKQDLIVSIIFVLFMLLITSTVMYHIEHEAQPDKFSSIPETMWWSIATLTTVGYGDVYPLTALGRLLGGMIAVLGLGLFALPTGIIASGFNEALSRENQKFICCPKCNHEFSK